jgi:predicted dehydrogenase
MAIIGPAKSHPEVIVAAVAARDERRARTYAKKHGIPVVCKGYQGMELV